VRPPRYHIEKYAGVLASASRLRSRIAPVPAVMAAQGDDGEALFQLSSGVTTSVKWHELILVVAEVECDARGGELRSLGHSWSDPE
jgi:hypothetical protein